jgi:hypothetical protein
MSSVDLPANEIDKLKNQAMEGEKAQNFKRSTWWGWFDSTVLKAMESEAMDTLRKASDEQGRMKAQMMAVAAQKVRFYLEALINRGNGALTDLEQISTPKEGENG